MTLSLEQKVLGVFAGAVMLGDLPGAALADDIKVSDVLSMDSKPRATFIMNTASDRIIQIGQAYGDKPLRCLSEIFTKVLVVDGKRGVSLGYGATLQFLVRANRTGKGAVAAEQAINLVVDNFATQKCGVSDSAATAQQ